MKKMIALLLILAITISVIPLTVCAAADTKMQAYETGKALAEKIGDEGIVLMKNKNNALPLSNNEKVALFGEGQHLWIYGATVFDTENDSCNVNSLTYQHGYIPWGAGSSRSTGIKTGDSLDTIDPLQALQQKQTEGKIDIYDELSQEYVDALEASTIPANYTEYIPDEAMYNASSEFAGTAVVIIRRWDGECVDMNGTASDGLTNGSRISLPNWELTADEKTMLQTVSEKFDKVVVILNTPGPIDTSWAQEDNTLGIDVDALLFAGYGGIQGGLSIANVLTGEVNPSGRLVDTWAKDIDDYPTTETFLNDSSCQKYTEDIYLGYRYFETFNIPVNYEFGFGLSYTTFDIESTGFNVDNGVATITAKVTNTGNREGKQVVQAYASQPQGVLGKPSRVLCAFGKTDMLEPGESQTLTLTVEINDLASYDDMGKTAYKSAYVLEAGDYNFYIGASVKDTALAGSYNVAELALVEQLSEQCPTNLEERLLADGTYEVLNEVASGESNLERSVTVEAENWYQFTPSDSYPDFTGSTDTTTAGKLYNSETDAWDSYGCTMLSNTWKTKSVTYKINVADEAKYNLTVRLAPHDTTAAGVTASYSTDNVNYTTITTLSQDSTKTASGSTYYGFIDVNDGTQFTLPVGVAYIRLTFTGAPNIDSFTIEKAGNKLKRTETLIIEAEAYDSYVLTGTTAPANFYETASNAKLYNESTGVYDSYSCTTLANTSKYKPTYKVYVEEAGSYGFGVYSAANVNYKNYGKVTLTSGETTLSSLQTAQTATESGSNYYGFKQYYSNTYFELEAGENELTFAFVGSLNVDKILLFPMQVKTVDDALEYGDASTSANHVAEEEFTTGLLYDGLTWNSCGGGTQLKNLWVKTPYIKFNVNAALAGTYTLYARIATWTATTTITHSVSYDNLTYTDGVTNTLADNYAESASNRYESFRDFELGTVSLNKGDNIIKLDFSGQGNFYGIILKLEEKAQDQTEQVIVVEPAEKDSYYQLSDVVNGTCTMQEFVGQMTTSELASFFVSYSAYNFGGSSAVQAKYGITGGVFADGPSGISTNATSFPCETVIASTWNVELAEAFGRVAGTQARINGVDVWAAPAMNLHRNPLSGRNSEYYSEDTYITAQMGLAVVKGSNKTGTVTVLKHFVLNEKEANKLSSDSRVSERALRELYLKPFEICIKEGNAKGLMSSYNLINGTPVTECYDLLTNIVRGEWGYEYYISGDWNNTKNAVNEVNAGNGVREPAKFCDINVLIEAIQAGEITRTTLETGASYELNTLKEINNFYNAHDSEMCNGSHDFVNGVCTKCKMTDSSISLTAELASLTHTHTDDDGGWEYDGTYRYHICACGEKFDYSLHTDGAETQKNIDAESNITVSESGIQAFINSEQPSLADETSYDFTVKAKEPAADIKTAMQNKAGTDRTLSYFDVAFTKTANNVTTEITDTQSNIISFTVQYDMTDKCNLGVFRYHGGEAEAFTQVLTTSNPQDKTFYVSGKGANTRVTVFASKFSSYGFGTTEIPEALKNANYLAALTLNDNIDIQFKMTGYTDAFDIDALTVTVDGTAITLAQGTDAVTGIIKSVAPNEIGAAANVAVIYNGVTVKAFSYSAAKYCKKALTVCAADKDKNNANGKLYRLCKALLNYGKYAEDYANKNTLSTVNDGYEIEFSDVTVLCNDKEAVTSENVTDAGASLTLESTVSLNFYVYSDTALTRNNIVILNGIITDSKAEKVNPNNITVAQYDEDGFNYKITVGNIGASKLSRQYTLKVEGDEEFEVSYGVYNYCSEAQEWSDETLRLLCKAIYEYGEASKAYAGVSSN